MNFLKYKRCYLSGPIEFENTSEPDWRPDVRSTLLTRYGVDLFDPYLDPKQQWKKDLDEARERQDLDMLESISSKFVRKDLGVVDRVDFLVAYLPRGIQTTGTVHEIIVASNRKIPTLLMCPEGAYHFPAWYYCFIPREMRFGNWSALYSYLDKVHRGDESLHKRWDFVLGKL